MALRAYTWNKSTGGTGNWNVAGNWTGVGSGYPGDGGGNDSATFPTGMEPCTVNTAVTINDLTINSDHSGADVIMAANLTCTGNVLLTQGELQTGNYDFNVSGTTDIYGTLTPGSSTCYFGYGNTTSTNWDLGVRGTGVLNAGTGDWYTGGVGCYSGADVSLTSGIIRTSGTAFGYLWSPDQGVGSWDNRDGTVILESTGELRTLSTADPLTAADKDICPFHTLILSGGTDRTDAPVVTLKRGLKVDDELIIKNGVLKWDTYAGSHGDVWAVNGTELTGLASQSAAIVFDDMPARSMYVSATGSSPTGDGFNLGANAIISGATAKLQVGNVMLGTDGGNSNSADNKAITGLNGSPYFTFPSGEACAVFGGMPEGAASSGEYINVGNVAELNNTQNFTISMWIKFGNPAPSEKNFLFAKGPSGVNSTKIRWSDGSGGKLYWYVNNGSSKYGRSTFTAATGYSWNHIALVYDGTFDDSDETVQNNGRLKAYVNGVLQTQSFNGEIPSSTTNDTPTSEAVLGITEPGSSTDVFFGSMADVRIYDESKDATAVAALAATNPATSTTGTYPDTGSGLVAWWKLGPKSISDGTGSGDMDFSDSSTSSYDATNVGTSRGWGGLWLNSNGASAYTFRTYQRSVLPGNNVSALGVEGRGSTVYITPRESNCILQSSDGYWNDSVAQYDLGRVLRFNNLNINAPTAGNGEVRSVAGIYTNGVVDCTGDLFIASGATLESRYTGTPSEKSAMAAGDFYASGNVRIYGTLDMNNAEYRTAFDAGALARLPQMYAEDSIHMYGNGHYNATPYLTITRDNPGMSREDSTTTFTHNSGTYIFADKADGGWGLGSNGWTGSNAFYNFIISGTNLYKSQPVNVDNDMTLKNCTAADPNFRPYVQPTYIGGNVNVESGCGFGNWYIASAAYNAPIYISGNLNMNGGDLYLSGDGGKDFHIYGSLYNRGGEIFDSEA